MVPVGETWLLKPTLESLRAAIVEQNRPGSVEGLLSRHILVGDSWADVSWQVDCNAGWIAESYKATSLECVASLGYSMWERFNPEHAPLLADGLTRITGRDPFSGGHLSLARNPARLLGVVLGALALGEDGVATKAWCDNVVTKVRSGNRGEHLDPLYFYIQHRCSGTRIALNYTSSDLYDLSFSDWVHRRGIHSIEPSAQQLEEAHKQILFGTATSLRFESAHQAAFIWSALNAHLLLSMGELRLQPKHVARLLEGFEAAMKRWRNDPDTLKDPIRWPVKREREVQDILWLILRPYFTDIIDEDTLPKFGHSSYKADFGIPSLKLVIEVKYAFGRDDFKHIEKEILQDAIPYLRDLRYDSMIVFIYDSTASVQEHGVTKSALMEIPGVSGVIIASRPSQLVS